MASPDGSTAIPDLGFLGRLLLILGLLAGLACAQPPEPEESQAGLAAEQDQALFEQASQVASGMGVDLPEATAGGGSDGNTASQVTATLDGLGPVGHGAHARHEFLYIDKTLERAALLTMLLLSPPTEVAALEEAG